jgi:D-alanyl-D-alanine carboxypeptidase
MTGKDHEGPMRGRVAAAAILAISLADGAASAAREPIYTDPARDALLVVNENNGATLFARNETVLRHPASLTKMMTLYLVFERLKSHQLTLQTPFVISLNAETQWPAKLHLRAGTTLTVADTIGAMAVCSANDAAVAAAENIAGTETHFAELMNAKAQAFGMTHTFYKNATGLPDQLQFTTASDLAILARHLITDFPEYFHYFHDPAFTFRGHDYPSHDALLRNYSGADGLKTGYTDASGYNLVTTAKRDGTRLIGVVLGGISAERRDKQMEHLLDAAFLQIRQKSNTTTSIVTR